MLCFVVGCNHQSLRETCRFFRFPTKCIKLWEKLCRRQDRKVCGYDRICSCHFKDGKKENGPTIFPWNKDKVFDFSDPPTFPRQKKPDEDQCISACKEEDAPQQPDETSPHQVFAQQIKEMEAEIEQLKAEVQVLKVKKQRFSVSHVINDEKKMLMYTSLKPDMFLILDDLIQRFDLTYAEKWKPGAISRTDQLFMTLMKFRLNCPFLDLAERFDISKAYVHNIIVTHIFALHEIMFQGMIENNIPSLLKCKSSMPTSFGDFSCCRIVIDATEITQDVPGQDMAAQSQTYSSYKNRHTVKSVTGVAPNGAVVYVSDLYPGNTSDVAIVEHSKMLSQMKPGDLILADKGFTIHSILPPGVHLNIPPFLKNKGQYTPAEVQVCRKIARSRIHVERVNERIKNFAILNHIPHQLRHLSTKIFQVCSVLVNFQDPMLAEIAEKYTQDSQ